MKIHGSSNFIPTLNPKNFRNISGVGSETDIECPMTAVSFDFFYKWHRESDHSFSPAMSMYMKSKRNPVCNDTLHQIREEWKTRILDCDTCYIIGVACVPEDEHIWETLARSGCRIVYVDPYPANFRKWVADKQRTRVDIWEKTFEDAVPAMADEVNDYFSKNPVTTTLP